MKTMFSFVRNCQSSKVMLPFYVPVNNEWKFLLFHTLISIWCCQCFGLAILIVWQWYFTVALFCISLTDIWPWAFFHMFIYHLYIYTCPFLNQVVLSSLFILNNRLSDMCAPNVVPCLCLVFFLTLSFMEHKFLILMKFSLLTISFVDRVFHVLF